jgi:Raf kinase inhibitor-like YbhB/YbcL family protein
MGLAREIGKSIGKVIEPIRAGDDKIASRKLGVNEDIRSIDVTSTAFTDGGTLPVAFTADGSGVAPPIAWSNVPESARSLVLIAEDPDAPIPKPFVHWLVYSLPVTTSSIATSPAGGREGKNSTLKTGYTPAAPPAGHGLHHYHFQVFALDTVLELGEGAGRSAVVEAMRNHVIAWGEIVATYERS